MTLADWIQEISDKDWLVYIKRLSGNDTGLTGGHQVGVYFPKAVLGQIFPAISSTEIENPEVYFKAIIDSHNLPEQTLRAIYYNQKTRNEKRITQWKQDVKDTPIQDVEMTGAIAIFAFHKSTDNDADYMKAWVCKDIAEEDFIEGFTGEIEPAQTYFEKGNVVFGGVTCSTTGVQQAFPEDWLTTFPTGLQIIDFLFQEGLFKTSTPDKRVLQRRNAEYDLFKQVEKHHTLPLIQDGFNDVDEFVYLANSISNRRKSRSGKSLELHLEMIFKEEGLLQFGTQCKTEGNKKPDFLFPSCEAYHDTIFPDEKLRVLAVKTTVKDRWRQVLNEADKIDQIFLFTLQQGVSENQFNEMKKENVTLVVPSGTHKSFPESVRGELYSLERFIQDTKSLY